MLICMNLQYFTDLLMIRNLWKKPVNTSKLTAATNVTPVPGCGNDCGGLPN